MDAFVRRRWRPSRDRLGLGQGGGDQGPQRHGAHRDPSPRVSPSMPGGRGRSRAATRKKIAEVVEHPEVFDHVGILANEPPELAGLPFI